MDICQCVTMLVHHTIKWMFNEAPTALALVLVVGAVQCEIVSLCLS